LKQLVFAKFGTTIKSALAFISDVIANKDANESKKTFKMKAKKHLRIT
jgi:hypothetical protein